MRKRLFTLLMGVEVEKERRTIRVLGCRSLLATHCTHCEESRNNREKLSGAEPGKQLALSVSSVD